jgi:hypothetical protein
MQQVKQGKTETEIRKSWEPALSNFKKIRNNAASIQCFKNQRRLRHQLKINQNDCRVSHPYRL